MKKIFYFAAAIAALILSASCAKELPSNKVSLEPAKNADQELTYDRDSETSSVTVNVTTLKKGLTKADGDAVADLQDERTINHLDVFFFRHDNARSLETYASSDTQTTNGSASIPDITVSNSTFDVFVVANGPASLKSSISSMENLKDAISAFTQNTASNFVMVGYKVNVDVSSIAVTTEGQNKYKLIDGVVLERVVNRINIKGLTKDFSSPSYQNATVKLVGAYVINAVKQAQYTAMLLNGNGVIPSDGSAITLAGAEVVPTAADASYWNYGYAPLDNPAVLFENNGLITKDIAAASQPVIAAKAQASDACGTSLVTGSGDAAHGELLYFYPNPAAEAVAAADGTASGEDYVTKLVLKVSVVNANTGLDKLYWYTIGIPQAADSARNLTYEINNITLRKAGNVADPSDPEYQDPNEYLSSNTVQVSMTVKDWVSASINGSYNSDLLD